jgi:hypothetical protein
LCASREDSLAALPAVVSRAAIGFDATAGAGGFAVMVAARLTCTTVASEACAATAGAIAHAARTPAATTSEIAARGPSGDRAEG